MARGAAMHSSHARGARRACGQRSGQQSNRAPHTAFNCHNDRQHVAHVVSRRQNCRGIEAHGQPAAAVEDKGEDIEVAPTLAGGGGGIFFFWQLGAIKYLQQRYDLGRVQFVGASAGALVVTLAACRVDPETAVEAAYRISLQARLFERRLGLLGIWGGLISQWLAEILPPDAAERCRGRLKLVVTDVLDRQQAYLEDFQTREELIGANLASIHIPFFLDWRPTRNFKGRPYVDGSLTDFLFWENGALLTLGGRSWVLDYSADPELQFGRLDFVKLRSYESVKELMAQGYAYAERTDADGGFDRYFGSVRL